MLGGPDVPVLVNIVLCPQQSCPSCHRSPWKFLLLECKQHIRERLNQECPWTSIFLVQEVTEYLQTVSIIQLVRF